MSDVPEDLDRFNELLAAIPLGGEGTRRGRSISRRRRRGSGAAARLCRCAVPSESRVGWGGSATADMRWSWSGFAGISRRPARHATQFGTRMDLSKTGAHG